MVIEAIPRYQGEVNEDNMILSFSFSIENANFSLLFFSLSQSKLIANNQGSVDNERQKTMMMIMRIR